VDRASDGERFASYAPDLLALAAASAPTGRAAGPLVAAYAGVDEEPPTRALLDALVAGGASLLLPVVDGDHLDWAAYAGWTSLRAVHWGLLEPAGEPLGPAALAGADLVIVPALAVDASGHRLGRGRGYYDRTLGLVRREQRVAMVYSSELVAAIPTESHDEQVGWALTPDGLQPLPA
jgi:5-formyltetrahydrofolate cyclo-ligase